MNRTNEEIAVEWSEEQQTVHMYRLKQRPQRQANDKNQNGYKLVCVCRSHSEAFIVGNLLKDSARLKRIRNSLGIS